MMWMILIRRRCFFFNDTATTEIYTLSLHDALPISTAAAFAKPEVQKLLAALAVSPAVGRLEDWPTYITAENRKWREDRKSTRLNSSHANISYAVFCLKKKNYHSLSLFLSYSFLLSY